MSRKIETNGKFKRVSKPDVMSFYGKLIGDDRISKINAFRLEVVQATYTKKEPDPTTKRLRVKFVLTAKTSNTRLYYAMEIFRAKDHSFTEVSLTQQETLERFKTKS